MALTLSNYDALLKDAYEGGVREQLNNEVPLFKLLDESDRAWSGRRVVYPAHTTRNSGVGSRTEGATLPTGGNQGHELVVVTATYFYARGRISGQTMAAGKHAFAEALAVEMDGLVNDAKVDLGRQTWGTGDGRIAQVGAASSGTAVSLYNRFFEPGQPGARYLSQEQLVDFGLVATPTSLGTGVTVKSISISSNPATTVDVVQVSGTYAGVSQCETFVFNRAAGGAGVECLGVRAIVDVFTESNIWGSNAYYGSAIYGINRALVSAWNATILGNSQTARIIDSNLMQIAFDRINEDTGDDPDIIMGHHSVIRAFLDSVSSDRRYVASGAPKYDAGFSGLSYNGVQLEYDRMAPYNELLVAKKAALKKFTLKPMGFADKDGAILSRVDGQDNWDFWMCTYFNLGVDGNMKSLLMIRDIKTDL